MKQQIVAALALLAVTGCTTMPSEYEASLSPLDPKWETPECTQARADAHEAEQVKPFDNGAALMLGPYGFAIAMASRDHLAKQRKLATREMHIQCSSLPLPRSLQG